MRARRSVGDDGAGEVARRFGEFGVEVLGLVWVCARPRDVMGEARGDELPNWARGAGVGVGGGENEASESMSNSGSSSSCSS